MAASVVRFESRTVVRRPAREVFERLADLPAYRQWMHRDGLFRRCESVSELPVREGTTYLDLTRMGRFEGRVVELVPPTRIAFSETLSWFGVALTRAEPAYVLEEDGDETVVHHTAVGELYGVMRLFRPAARWMADRERDRTLASLKRSLEQAPTTGSGA
ncbi:SRPBCC family protein [Terrabacter carboxydivorans]|uniref:Polyketide cyclase n=1 Tax=Terrabacter carboxydivorans TaxID=619730 RepID=A0ABN3MH94_9MICO